MKIDGKEYVCITVDKTERETDEAVLFIIDDEKIWIPKSQLEDYPDVGEDGDVLVTEWWAEKEGLI